jgi:hypothetical protein
MANAPLILPLTSLRLPHRSFNEAVHLLPMHLVHPINPIHTELENLLRPSSNAAVHLPSTHLPFDLSFRDYPEEQHEKLASIVVLLVHSERLDKSGDFKRRDQVNDQARKLLYSLGKQTVLKVGRDAQFLQLRVLKHIFQIDP